MYAVSNKWKENVHAQKAKTMVFRNEGKIHNINMV